MYAPKHLTFPNNLWSVTCRIIEMVEEKLRRFFFHLLSGVFFLYKYMCFICFHFSKSKLYLFLRFNAVDIRNRKHEQHIDDRFVNGTFLRAISNSILNNHLSRWWRRMMWRTFHLKRLNWWTRSLSTLFNNIAFITFRTVLDLEISLFHGFLLFHIEIHWSLFLCSEKNSRKNSTKHKGTLEWLHWLVVTAWRWKKISRYEE